MRLSRTRLWGIGLAAALTGAALVPLIATADFTDDRELWIALTLVIGYGFAGVGLFAWYRRPDNPVGALMVVTAFAWYISHPRAHRPAAAVLASGSCSRTCSS